MDEFAKRCKPAFLDFDPKKETRKVYDKHLGEFVTPSRHFVKEIPLDWLIAAGNLSKTAIRVAHACWFLDGCNRKKPFKLNRFTSSRFGLDRRAKHRGLRKLEEAGLIKIHRIPGSLSIIEMLRDGTVNRD